MTMELKKIENRIKKIKIDTTIEDVGDLFEEEARAEVKRNEIPLEDEEGVPYLDETLESMRAQEDQR